MRIQLVQTGGFAGLRLERNVETLELPAATRAVLEGRVTEARFFELPERSIQNQPDMIQYRITVETPAVRHEVVFDDGTATQVLRGLVEAILLASDVRPKETP